MIAQDAGSVATAAAVVAAAGTTAADVSRGGGSVISWFLVTWQVCSVWYLHVFTYACSYLQMLYTAI